MKMEEKKQEVEKVEQVVEKTVQKVMPPKNNYWEIEDLPSKYRLYPEGTKIKGRPMKVLDTKYLATIDENNFGQVINEILRRCLRIEGMDLGSLLVPDKLYILFWLRANTYKNSGYSVDFECPKCEKASSYDFSLDSLNVIYIKDGLDVNKPIKLPVSEDEIKVRYQCIADEVLIEECINKHESPLVKFDTDILSVASIITDVKGNTDWSVKRTYDYLVSLDPSDYAYIESYIKHIDMGISSTIEVKCNKCGGSALTGVTFQSDFFVPKYKFE